MCDGGPVYYRGLGDGGINVQCKKGLCQRLWSIREELVLNDVLLLDLCFTLTRGLY